MGSLHPAFNCHRKSSEPTSTTYDFLLLIRSNHRPGFGQNSQNFPIGSSWNFVAASEAEKK